MENQHLKSYLPELTLLEKKHSDAKRTAFEDLAAVASDGYRVLAYRGRGGRAKSALPARWKLPQSELAFWEQSSSNCRRALLRGEKNPVLIFGDLMDTTGVLLTARLPIPASTVLALLRHLRRDDVAVSPAIRAHHPDTSLPDGEICEDMMRLFYYVDRILDDARFQIGLWSRVLLIAEFVGCRLDETGLSVKPPSIAHGDTARLTAFLLCAMLELRRMDGRVRAKNGEHPLFSCRVELERLENEHLKATDEPPEFPLLDLPAFNGFSLCRENGRLILEAHLPIAAQVGVLHAHIASQIRLKFFFSHFFAETF